MTNVSKRLYSPSSAMVASPEECARKTARKGTLAEFLLASPLRGAAIDLERQLEARHELPSAGAT
jgi:hypothetical protein